ncbi:MAG: hypothetical protein WD069_20335 [Planctomycetales bacterium]
MLINAKSPARLRCEWKQTNLRRMNADTPIDWAALAAELGIRSGISSHDAAKALARLIGDVRLAASVDFYVGAYADSTVECTSSLSAGAELARLALRPRAAIERCCTIYKNHPGRRRRVAVELLRTIADESVIPWIDEFLNDPDEYIQSCGASALQELIFADLIEPEQVEPFLAQFDRHPNAGVRHVADEIRKHREWVAGLSRDDDATPAE